MKANKRGFTLIEIVAAISLIMLVIGCISWNIPSLMKYGDKTVALQRASMITAAKEAFLRENQFDAITAYNTAKTEEEKFILIRPYLPYCGKSTSIFSYQPRGYRFEMGTLGSKIDIYELKTNKKVLF